jgi:hypothetical protein
MDRLFPWHTDGDDFGVVFLTGIFNAVHLAIYTATMLLVIKAVW